LKVKAAVVAVYGKHGLMKETNRPITIIEKQSQQ
jgi:hypothetical protein